ncbi:AI-2E family transporter [Microbacterium bovistercoris]|uniref:AI-2E family transporter n=1 Tax=Microbacterium bovistercoris TaxID=2293570 RepID=UPI001FEA8DFF|nr:AI-2E family transporter [Microbacterium bovistercoris]
MRAILERPLVIAFIATIGVLGGLVLGTAVGSITTVLVYIVLALFVSLGLDPVVKMLERWGMRRGAGIGLVFGVFALLAAAVLVFVLPSIIAQIGQFVVSVRDAAQNLESNEWYRSLPPDAQSALSQALDEASEALSQPSTLAAVGGGALAVGVGIASAVSAGFIVVALTLYFLSSLSGMKQALYSLAPARNRPRFSDITERVTASVGSSLLGSVTISAINAAVVLALHLLLGLPFAVLMATIAFVITLVPLFGSVIFLVLGTLVALLSSPTQAIAFGVFYLIYIQIESYVVTPRIMNRAIAIPAALVLIGAMVGGTLLGILGVLIALPVMATILLIIREIVVPRQDAKV